MANILIAEDEEKMRKLLSIIIESRGHRVVQASNGIEALDKLKSGFYDMLISDIKMPQMDGLLLLKKIKEQNLFCPVVFITAFATIDSAVDAMRQGAADYITKPFDEERIFLTIERTLNLSKIIAENKALKQEIKMSEKNHEIVYNSKEMKIIIDLSLRVAQTDSAVIISGESGTGKELLARFIHQNSLRKESRFVPINCAAISPNLIESELFGHERGAFTGADKKALGKFEFASGGTIFLDEIGDLPMEAQAKLLRALQEKKIQRVGGNEEVKIDVRIICATNKNLGELVSQGTFRADLFFRINVFPIQPPPLRNRMDDVVPLANYFLSNLNKTNNKNKIELSEGAINALLSHNWPGNVRELANAMERALIITQDKSKITADVLSFLKNQVFANKDHTLFELPPEGICLEEFEQDLVKQALQMASNNQTSAAKLLGLSRAKFRVLMKQQIYLK